MASLIIRKGITAERKERTTLKTLLNEPIPSIKFTNGGTTSAHISGHDAVEVESRGELSILQSEIDDAGDLEMPSRFLLDLTRKGTVFEYTSEADLQTLVGDLLTDVLVMLRLESCVSLSKVTYVPHAKYLKAGYKSDFWLILDVHKRPIMVVEVKSPHIDPNLLEFPVVKGQIVDYMLDVASFYGQRDVFGITTTGLLHDIDISSQCV